MAILLSYILQKTNNESIIKTSDAKNNVDDDEVPIRPARKKQPSSNKCVSVEPNSPPVDNINGEFLEAFSLYIDLFYI